MLKESWWSKDRNRPERGRELREDFLKKYASEIESEIYLEQIEEQANLTEIEDTTLCLSRVSERRTLKPPKTHYLPALNLAKYMKEDKIVEYPWLKTESDYELLKKQHSTNIIDSEQDHYHYLNYLNKLVNKQFGRYIKLFRKKEETFRERRALIDVAYESRKVYIDTLMSEKTKFKGKNKKNN